MGACSFRHSIIAKTASEGFNDLYEEAISEYGHDSYNGKISTTELGRCVKTFDKPTKTAIKEAEKLADDKLGECCKRQAYYMNLGLVKMELTTVDSKRGTYMKPQYKEQYVCYVSEGWRIKENEVAAKDTLKAAKEFAINYALKNGKEVDIRKERKLVKGETTVGQIVITRRVIKTIPKNIKPNQRIEKYYQFLFFGWAGY
jgi:hypothetical protein